MGKTHVFDVCDQFFGQLFVSQPVIVFRIALPRTQMYFINADRRINGIGAGAEGRFFHFVRQAAHDRCRGRAQFRTKSIRVGFFTYITVGIADFKFV